MGIYVPHQKMPSSAGMCSVKINPEERKCIFTGKVFEETLGLLIEHRCKDCPLIEIKEPHGRLVDIATVYQDTMQYGNHFRESVLKIINDLPTVIESEG